MYMNINNYNELSPLPVDVLTGKVIPFGTKIVLFDDDSISIAEGITARCNVSAIFILIRDWWVTCVELERNAFADAAEYLAWEYEQADFGDLYHASEFELQPVAGL
ncbi:hypothetical protein AB1I68_00580 [Paenibacillus pabuli]|uniref:hypothetical protein n=1 Tax=Paenibacillus pabuli TaxID=1472 RepID=UPI00345A1664